MKTLVFDNNEHDINQLTQLLEETQFEVIVTHNGKQALELLGQMTFDLIFADVTLTGINEMIAKNFQTKQTDQRHTPVILLSPEGHLKTVSELIKIGADGFVLKPFNLELLKAKIDAHTRIKNMTDSLFQQKELLKAYQNEIVQERQIARSIFKKAKQACMLNVPSIQYCNIPANEFSGDLILGTPSPQGGLYILLADFTGHGLPAAVSSLPVTQVFFETAKSIPSVGSIAREINRRLKKYLPANFFAATSILEISSNGRRITFWNGGLPDVMIVKDGKVSHQMTSKHLPLGILSDNNFQENVDILELEEGSKVLVYSDGIIEAINDKHDLYGLNRLSEVVENTPPGSNLVKAIISDAKKFIATEHFTDDVTILEILCTPLKIDNKPINPKPHKFPWSLKIELGPEQLRQPSTVTEIVDIICQYQLLVPCKDEIHCILTEIYDNALEHGILGLESSYKKSRIEMDHYLARKNELITGLKDGFISIEITHLLDAKDKSFHIKIKDSGSGFTVKPVVDAVNKNDDKFGRGLVLLNKLCDKIQYSEEGTRRDLIYTPTYLNQIA